MGVEPTQDLIGPETVLKTAEAAGPLPSPCQIENLEEPRAFRINRTVENGDLTPSGRLFKALRRVSHSLQAGIFSGVAAVGPDPEQVLAAEAVFSSAEGGLNGALSGASSAAMVGDKSHLPTYPRSMKSMTIRDLRTRPRQVRKTIAAEPQSLLTANGKPFALLIPVDSETLDETVDALRIGRAQIALRVFRGQAKREGRDQLTMGEIDEVVAKTRRQRRTRSSRAARR